MNQIEARMVANREAELRATLTRVRESLATFVRENSDPGVEALCALDEATRVLKTRPIFDGDGAAGYCWCSHGWKLWRQP